MSPPAPIKPTTKERLSIIVRKVIVTGAVGTLAYFLTEFLLDDATEWSLLASVFLGGVAFVTQFLVDVERRIEQLDENLAKHRVALDKQVKVSFRRINEATRLHDLVSESNVPGEVIAKLIEATVKVDRGTPPLAAGLATAELRRLLSVMEDLDRNRETEYVGEDRDWLLYLAEHSVKSIKATSLTTVDAGGAGFTDGGLWQTDLGMRYLDIQESAIKRGVKVQRIFITDMPEIKPDGPFAEIFMEHSARGIEVRVFNPHEKDNRINANKLFDFIVFDETLTYETTPAARPNHSVAPLILHTRMTVKPAKVEDRIQRFDALWEAAVELPVITGNSRKDKKR